MENNGEPTMKGNQEEEKVTQERLNQLFQILQKEWDSFQSSSKPRIHGGRHSPGSITILNPLQFLQNSPKNLVVSQETWKVRTNELALEEIIRKRKGRRVFEEDDEMGLGIMADMFMKSVSGYDSDEGKGDLGDCANSFTDSHGGGKMASIAEERRFNNGGRRCRTITGLIGTVAFFIFGFYILSIGKIRENEICDLMENMNSDQYWVI